MKKLNKIQEQRLEDYFKDEDHIDQRYYDFVISIIEDDGFIDESIVSDYESEIMG